MESIIKLRDQLKRVEILTHDQRFGVFGSVLTTVFSIAILYYTPFQILIVPFVIVLNYFLLGKILVNRKQTHIITRLIRPSLWLLVLYGYIFTIHVLFLIPIFWFVVACIAIGLGYYGILLQEFTPKPNIILNNILQIILLIFGVSFASLMLAYWHWSTVIVMLGLWVSVFYLAITWLISFTNKPYIIASVWALMVLEVFWITSRWINLYHIPKTSLLVSQSALVIGALAYGFGGLYYHYKNKTLKISLIFEYILVTAVVFVALMLLSKWSVAI